MNKPEINDKITISGYTLITGYLGIVMIMAGVITLLPLLTLIFYPQELDQAGYFIVPGVISILAGYLTSLVLRGKKLGNLERNQEMIVVVATWMITIGVTAAPFVLTGNYTFTQAVFETTSGLSTTGLSVVDTAMAPRIFLIHRTVLLFFGGIGLVLVMTSVLSDIYGMRLYNAEGHSDRLLPNLLESARLIIGIYSGYILAGTALYVLFGMSPFDAFNHSIAALSTGGFSTRPESIGFYDSAAIEMITIVLMLLGGTNFLIHLLLLRGKIREVLFHCETRITLFLLAFFSPLMLVLLMHGMYNEVSTGLRTAVFQAVSALTTTGFQTVETFQTWSSPLMLIMIVLMLIGGSAGSTAGGLKAYRVYVILKEMKWKLVRDICPNRMVFTETIPRYGKEEAVTSREKEQIHTFVCVYLLLFLAGTFVFCLFGYSVQDSMFEFASALSTVGLSMGITAYDASPVIHWTASAGMFLGRLEVFAVLIGAARMFSDGKGKAAERKTGIRR
ncbi:TrkH family potassium uptake protein [Clostridium sp. MCC353]|uniref:TrkH family potassium uptake protein n=1 Tax=Clostridium sp. MCC353 TaxID=2592646 RepID=UPI001C024777|nr:TrkH family potassium uptake protein [Clostridium sp. MCC353]